ncbi:hypothetical protein Gromo_00532 [Candidatus Gromoviella agglomerans]|nr:hypothetical protein Gromo_00532 [Candidatus Gromoviella agglomerans]
MLAYFTLQFINIICCANSTRFKKNSKQITTDTVKNEMYVKIKSSIIKKQIKDSNLSSALRKNLVRRRNKLIKTMEYLNKS